MSIPISITITDPLPVIEQRVNGAIAKLTNDRLTKKLNVISNRIKSLITTWITGQPEISSLLSRNAGSLGGMFGVVNPLTPYNDIIVAIQNSVTVRLNPFNNSLVGGLYIEIQPSDFANILSLASGHTRYSGGDLHWLEWLLRRGDSIIIMNYSYDPVTGMGRTGLGHMVPGGSFRVPPQFSGTEKDNFITRALSGKSQEQAITKIIQDALSNP